MEWINFDDVLPESDTRVLALLKHEQYIHIEKFFGDFDSRIDKYSHWMPLPEPPKEI